MALWLHLVPQLHRPGVAAPRHHHFRERDPEMYSGAILAERHVTQLGMEDDGEDGSGAAGEEECDTPRASPRPALPALPAPTTTDEDLLKTFTDTHYYSYTMALGVTVAVGCFLLALNILIFAGIYYQRGRGKRRRQKRRQSLHREGSTQVSKGLEVGAGSICHIKPMRSHTLPRQVGTACDIYSSTESEAAEASHGDGGGTSTLPPKKRVQIQEICV